ncbi:MAG: D-alanyl-D-alanine carboxypeptidase family protein, partial [Gemmatimonadales bacterium]
GINVYAFAGANPVSGRDPRGLTTPYWTVQIPDAAGPSPTTILNKLGAFDDPVATIDIRGGGGGFNFVRDPCSINSPLGIAIVDESIASRTSDFLNDLARSGFQGAVTSSFRSTAFQMTLYLRRATNRYPVARPRYSRHEAGFAIDFSFPTLADEQILLRVAAGHGFSPVIGDKVHFEADTLGPFASRTAAIAHNQAAAAQGVSACTIR